MKAPELIKCFIGRLLRYNSIGMNVSAELLMRSLRCFRILSVCIFLVSWEAEAVQSGSVDYLVSLVRHGDRSPRELDSQNELWPVGSGQLTPLGAQQMVTLGQEVRQHYFGNFGNFGNELPEVWSFSLSQHFAKGTHRTLQSASAPLQGLSGRYHRNRLACEYPAAAGLLLSSGK